MLATSTDGSMDCSIRRNMATKSFIFKDSTTKRGSVLTPTFQQSTQGNSSREEPTESRWLIIPCINDAMHTRTLP